MIGYSQCSAIFKDSAKSFLVRRTDCVYLGDGGKCVREIQQSIKPLHLKQTLQECTKEADSQNMQQTVENQDEQENIELCDKQEIV